MVALIMGITTLLNIAIIPVIAGVFGGWITGGGFDLSTITDVITNLF